VITRVARPYARALLDSVRPEDALAVRDDLLRVRQALELVPALGAMAINPSIPAEVKERTLDEVARALAIGEPARRLVLLLARNFRFGQLPAILEAYEELHDRRRGVARAKVTSAQPLGAGEVQELERTLRRLLGHEVRVELAVDAKLLAGFVVQVGSVRYDSSLDGQLRRLRERLGAAA
jgi:F-type H+-transporting ATPase subunit delta